MNWELEPSRWRARSGAETSLEQARIAELWRRAQPYQDRAIESLPIQPWKLPVTHQLGRWGMTLPLVLGAALAAAWMVRRHAPSPEPHPVVRLESPPVRATAETPVLMSSSSALSAAPHPQAVSRPHRSIDRLPPPKVAVPIPAPRPEIEVVAPIPTPTDPAAKEANELNQALYLLHRRDPAGALAQIVVYRHLYPQGALRAEADLAEIKVDLALQRKAEALELLDRLDVGGYAGVPRAQELKLLRAELLADAGRCPAALPELEQILQDNTTVRLDERALFARATCRVVVGDSEAGRRDYQEYLQRFPRGQFAGQVLRALHGDQGGAGKKSETF